MAKSNDHVDQHKLFTTSVTEIPEGYYSGDKPNSNLKKFVEEHIKERPYSPKDSYKIDPLLKSSKIKRSTKVYNMHTYWSKKPHDAIAPFVEHYTSQGDLVLDPFCGSGGTLLVSLMNNRKAIGIDLSPAATFLSSSLCVPPQLDLFNSKFREILTNIRKNYSWLYEYPYKGRTWPIHYGISSMKFKCIKCLTISSIYSCGTEEDGAKCPNCGELIKSTQDKLGYQLDEWHLYIKHGEHHVVPVNGIVSDYEKNIQDKILLELSIHKPPKLNFPKNGRTQVLYVRGITDITKLYSERNLLALCLYRDECLKIEDEALRNALLFVLTACCLKTSRMMGLNSDGIGRIQKNGLIAQLIVKDVNVLDFLEIAQKGISAGYEEILSVKDYEPKVVLSTQSSTDLQSINSNSVDYIFTDPPYGYRVQFWESNQVWEAWLGFDTEWQDFELIVNKNRGLDESHWQKLFHEVMKECYRVLKPGRWITLTYNDRDTWPILQDVMLETGFIPDMSDSPVTMETTAKSEKQLKGEDNTLRDLIVNFRKPSHGEIVSDIEITGDEDDKTFSDKVLIIVTEFLRNYPGSTRDRIYDEVVSKMISKGELKSLDIDNLLIHIAEEALTIDQNCNSSNRWYLKEDEISIDDAESAKEDKSAQKIADFISKHLAKHPHLDGAPFSEIIDYYFFAIKDKPRRPLVELLSDYFIKTDNATYRLPISDEEKRLKAEGRSKGTQRSIKRYIAFLQQSVAIPEKERPNDSTLAEWIRHCKRSGLYEQGKLLYEKGGLNLDGLAEEAMVNVEEDYQVCVRMLARGGVASTEAKPKRGRKA